MSLSIDEALLFFKLHRALMFFVNERRRVLPDKLSSPEEFGSQSPEAPLQVHNALLNDIDLIESFVDALRRLRTKFANLDVIGPVWAARMVESVGGNYEQARRDAFERVNALLDALGIEQAS